MQRENNPNHTANKESTLLAGMGGWGGGELKGLERPIQSSDRIPIAFQLHKRRRKGGRESPALLPEQTVYV